MTKKWIPKNGQLAIYEAKGGTVTHYHERSMLRKPDSTIYFESEIVQICIWYKHGDFAKICKYRAKTKKESVIVRKSYLKEYIKENN